MRVAAFLAGAFAASAGVAPAEARSLEYTETLTLEASSGLIRIWLPVPRETPVQSVELLELSAPFAKRRTRDLEFGTPMLHLEGTAAGPVVVRARYRVRRLEQRRASPARLAAAARKRYLAPRGRVIVDDEVRRIAAEAAGDEMEPVPTGRKLYQAVLDRMAYDKNEPGWGEGDTARACRVGKGNCTDFHSLFLSLAIARGLPARFIMGVPLSAEPEQQLGRRYHCWAEFYAKGRGWIPVDISEAWKEPKRRDFFFGSLDDARIELSVGRDLRLDPPQAGPRLNYFAYPYVEVGGRPGPVYELERKVALLPERG